MDSELKFVMKTDDIKAPDTAISSTNDNNNKNEGFFDWCKKIVVTIKNKIASTV